MLNVDNNIYKGKGEKVKNYRTDKARSIQNNYSAGRPFFFPSNSGEKVSLYREYTVNIIY